MNSLHNFSKLSFGHGGTAPLATPKDTAPEHAKGALPSGQRALPWAAKTPAQGSQRAKGTCPKSGKIARFGSSQRESAATLNSEHPRICRSDTGVRRGLLGACAELQNCAPSRRALLRSAQKARAAEQSEGQGQRARGHAAASKSTAQEHAARGALLSSQRATPRAAATMRRKTPAPPQCGEGHAVRGLLLRACKRLRRR